MKVVRQINLERKKKTGDRGVTLSNSQEILKRFAENIHTSTHWTALLIH